MKELTLDDLKAAGAVLHRCVPDLTDAFVLGSGAVSAQHPTLDAALRRSVDVDIAPSGREILYFDSKFVEQYAGQDSEFQERHQFFVDYVSTSLLRCTPPGWQQRVHTFELAPGLRGHCLDPHDVAYNKLWAGRPKDITWVHGLLGTGIITWARLEELHRDNPIAVEEREKVDSSMAAVRALACTAPH